MKNVNWKKLLSRSVEEADALAKITCHQKQIDCLCDYEGRIVVDGEDYSLDVLKLLYLEALDNICSPAVLDFLSSLEPKSIADELINEVFLDMALSQKKKTRFTNEFEKLCKEKNAREKGGAVEVKKLCQYVVEDALFELGLKVRLNLVTKKIEVSGCKSDNLYELYSKANILNILPSLILDHLKAFDIKGLGQGTKLIEQYLFNIADFNRYNPIHEMLESYENDDRGNLDLLYSIMGVEDEFDRLLIKKWFIQSAALAYNELEKPVSTEGVLVLQGPQGCGKTSFFRRMALKGEWFTEGAVIDMKNKDSLISAVSTWICELGEIDMTLYREQSALKAFITRPVDRIRFPYAAAESELVRTTSLCGTVNPDRFLNDDTGSRRYWVINVSDIDKKFLFSMDEDTIKNIWGYFYHLYKENADSFRLSDEDRAKLEKRNRAYNCEMKYEAEVMELLDFSLPEEEWRKVSPAKIAELIRGSNAVQIGRVLTKLSEEDERVEKVRNSTKQIYYLPVSKAVFI